MEMHSSPKENAGKRLSCTLLGAGQGCEDDCRAGISEHAGTEYSLARSISSEWVQKIAILIHGMRGYLWIEGEYKYGIKASSEGRMQL